ncbi:cytochrome P450 [Schizophyllum commune H4-8]|nr:cytochrome P450 [Schizophyllum commune H4-8]KAI5894181.1 cytochrome P450 [Schizophyllum commune H4-8]
MTIDPKALGHILAHDEVYQKPAGSRFNLAQTIGPGLPVTEGAHHRLQRRIMNAAFGSGSISRVTGVIVEKSVKLCEEWKKEIKQSDGVARINVMHGLSNATLDAMGKAGFGYDIDALDAQHGNLNELLVAFNTLFDVQHASRAKLLLQSWIPVLRLLPSGRKKALDEAQGTLDAIGSQLLGRAKSATEQEQGAGSDAARDIFSNILRTNARMKEVDRRMTDEDIRAQVAAFLAGGYETTSTAMTWALFQLSRSPEMQKRLRDELRSLQTDEPTMDDLNSLPFLDNFVKEVFRYYPSFTWSAREALQDDVIPLQDPFVDRRGRVCHELRVRKGQHFLVPYHSANRSKAIWGEDAYQFKPDRWDYLPDTVKSMPGIWGNTLAFSAGAHACIGFRFAVVEMKSLLFFLVRHFEFELAVPVDDVRIQVSLVQRPALRSEPHVASQLPMLVRVAA